MCLASLRPERDPFCSLNAWSVGVHPLGLRGSETTGLLWVTVDVDGCRPVNGSSRETEHAPCQH